MMKAYFKWFKNSRVDLFETKTLNHITSIVQLIILKFKLAHIPYPLTFEMLGKISISNKCCSF